MPHNLPVRAEKRRHCSNTVKKQAESNEADGPFLHRRVPLTVLLSFGA